MRNNPVIMAAATAAADLILAMEGARVPRADRQHFAQALAGDLKPARTRLHHLLEEMTEENWREKVTTLGTQWDAVVLDCIWHPEAGAALARLRLESLLEGMQKQPLRAADASAITTALQQWARRQPLPTALSSAELRDQIARDILRSSVFSARTTEIHYLEDVQATLAKMLLGDTNLASARHDLQLALDLLSYNPQTHFGTEEDKDIPPAEEGSLRDLSSDKRVDLVLNTNLRMAANLGQEIDGNEPDALWQFPCWELVRFYDREVPRGLRRASQKEGGGLIPEPEEAWAARWLKAGGTLYEGRMIARKDDPIWDSLGDSALFDDATDSAVPPFAFNSGYDWREVGRDEAAELGVIEPDEEVGHRRPDLVGKLFDDPAKATLGEPRASRADLAEALQLFRSGRAVKVEVS